MSDVRSILFLFDPAGQLQPADDDHVLREARARLDARIARHGLLGSPGLAKDFFTLRLGALEHEVFAVAFLDVRNQVIADRELFRGTLTQTAVYPREVVKAALALNAAAVIVAHCHPSGSPEPSAADVQITRALRDALALVDVRVLDHLVIAAGQALSFAERGLL